MHRRRRFPKLVDPRGVKMTTVTGLPDKPLDDAKEDFLNRRAFANALSD
jgi:hypothetical protein